MSAGGSFRPRAFPEFRRMEAWLPICASLSVALDPPNGRCRMHGGPSPGAPKGNKNAWKHGYYSAEAIAMRQTIEELLRQQPRPLALVDCSLKKIGPLVIRCVATLRAPEGGKPLPPSLL